MTKTLLFSVSLNAPKETVWTTLWSDASFRDWANLIDEGTYIVGEIKEGKTIQFMSGNSGYGVTSLVSKLIPFEFILFKHMADTKDLGTAIRDNEWTGGSESYALIENNGITTLTVESEIPENQEELFIERIPKALERIKVLSEGNTK
jgi:hypothetical protein